MIDARENIHYNQFLKLSSTYWSVVVNGEGCLTTIPRGKVSIITTINGDKEGRVEHFLEKLVRKIRRKRGQASSPLCSLFNS